MNLRVGPRRFRDPPHPSGVATGFYVSAPWPRVEPETGENRFAFRAAGRTEEGQRVLLILFEADQPGMPRPVARWMLQNAARRPSREEAGRADLEAFAAASPETSGLRALPGRPKPGPIDDVFHGALADWRFLGMRCGRDRDHGRLTSCQLWFDWRQGTWLEVGFIRTQMPRWCETAEATLAHVDVLWSGRRGPTALDVDTPGKTKVPSGRSAHRRRSVSNASVVNATQGSTGSTNAAASPRPFWRARATIAPAVPATTAFPT